MIDLEKMLARRRLLSGGLALGLAAWLTPGVFAEALARTPDLTEGPYYPDKLPLDMDNDLIVIGDSTTPAVGEITMLSGRILDSRGDPIKDAQIEIWQCDAKQVYLNSKDSVPKADQRDKNFQGYGRFETGSKGEYLFRTIKPVPYPGRPAGHIHFRVKKGGKELLTSQIFVAGAPGNRRDGIFMETGDAVERELVQADFVPIKDSKTASLAAKFDIVIGVTPSDRKERRL